MRLAGLSIEDAVGADWLAQRSFWKCGACGSDGGKNVEMTNTVTGEPCGTAYWGPQMVTDPGFPEYHGRAWCSGCGSELESA